MVGGFVAATILVITFFLWNRRRRLSPAALTYPEEVTHGDSARDAEPYVLQPTSPGLSKWQRYYAPESDYATRSWTTPADSEAPATSAGGASVATNHSNHTDLPALIRHLYDLVQGRHEHGELPPQYEG